MKKESIPEELGEKLRRLEEAWYDAERKLQELQRFTKAGIWEHDWINKKVWLSAELYRLFKIEGLNRLISDQEGMISLIHPDDIKLVTDAYRQSVQDKKILRITHRAILPNGELRYMEQTCETQYNEQGEPLLTTGITQDITEKHMAFLNLYESEYRFRNLLLKAPIPYQSLNEKGHFLFVNEALSDLLGYDPQKLVGNPFYMVWPEDERKFFSNKFEALIENGSIICELDLVRADGAVKKVVLAGRAVHNLDNSSMQTHCMLFDITDRKLIEEQLLATRKLLKEINSEENEVIQLQLNQLLDNLLRLETSLSDQENAKTWVELIHQCKLDLISASKVIHENDSTMSAE